MHQVTNGRKCILEDLKCVSTNSKLDILFEFADTHSTKLETFVFTGTI